jgi:hypothetical protein
MPSAAVSQRWISLNFSGGTTSPLYGESDPQCGNIKELCPMALSKTTQDHDDIRKCAEARGAVPAEVARTHTNSGPGILRFQFPNAPNQNDGNLREISWEDFFEKFDAANLELVYQEKAADGQTSNFNSLFI